MIGDRDVSSSLPLNRFNLRLRNIRDLQASFLPTCLIVELHGFHSQYLAYRGRQGSWMPTCLTAEDLGQSVSLNFTRLGIQIECGVPFHLHHVPRRMSSERDVQAVKVNDS